LIIFNVDPKFWQFGIFQNDLLSACCGFFGFYVKGMMLNKESNCTLKFRVMHSCLKHWITLKMAALRYFESSATTQADTASLPRKKMSDEGYKS